MSSIKQKVEIIVPIDRVKSSIWLSIQPRLWCFCGFLRKFELKSAQFTVALFYIIQLCASISPPEKRFECSSLFDWDLMRSTIKKFSQIFPPSLRLERCKKFSISAFRTLMSQKKILSWRGISFFRLRL